MHRLLVCSFIAMSPFTFAATEFVDSIPIEMARSLFRGPTGLAPQFFQDVPDDFPLTAFPRGLEVLGSSDQGYSQSVVLVGEEGNRNGQRQLLQQLEEGGWKTIPIMRINEAGVGFVTSESPEQRSTPMQFCHDEIDGNMSLNEVAIDGAKSALVVSRLRQEQFFNQSVRSCDEQIAQSALMTGVGIRGLGGRPNGVEAYMPRLEVPTTDTDTRTMAPFVAAGRGGSSTDWETHFSLTLDWALSNLLDHFTPQLEAQEWTQAGSAVAGLMGTSTWTRTVDNDVQMIGVLSILEIGTDRFELKFRLLRQQP